MKKFKPEHLPYSIDQLIKDLNILTENRSVIQIKLKDYQDLLLDLDEKILKIQKQIVKNYDESIR